MHTEWVAHSITPLLGEAMPLIHKWKYAEDPYHTFRVDPANAVIRVTYEDYPGQSFDDHAACSTTRR